MVNLTQFKLCSRCLLSQCVKVHPVEIKLKTLLLSNSKKQYYVTHLFRIWDLQFWTHPLVRVECSQGFSNRGFSVVFDYIRLSFVSIPPHQVGGRHVSNRKLVYVQPEYMNWGSKFSRIITCSENKFLTCFACTYLFFHCQCFFRLFSNQLSRDIVSQRSDGFFVVYVRCVVVKFLQILFINCLIA